jgi:hypothetical protein
MRWLLCLALLPCCGWAPSTLGGVARQWPQVPAAVDLAPEAGLARRAAVPSPDGG